MWGGLEAEGQDEAGDLKDREEGINLRWLRVEVARMGA